MGAYAEADEADDDDPDCLGLVLRPSSAPAKAREHQPTLESAGMGNDLATSSCGGTDPAVQDHSADDGLSVAEVLGQPCLSTMAEDHAEVPTAHATSSEDPIADVTACFPDAGSDQQAPGSQRSSASSQEEVMTSLVGIHGSWTFGQASCLPELPELQATLQAFPHGSSAGSTVANSPARPAVRRSTGVRLLSIGGNVLTDLGLSHLVAMAEQAEVIVVASDSDAFSARCKEEALVRCAGQLQF